MDNFIIEKWNEDKFMHSRNEWNELLLRSNADQLFLSWEWQSCWWRMFSDPDEMELMLYVATSGEGKLVGIAPLFSSKVRTRGFVTSRRLQFIGNCWRGKPTMLTELLNFVVDQSVSTKVLRTLCEYINSLRNWDEFVIPYMDTDSDTYRLLLDERPITGCYLRHAENHKSYYLKIKNGFDSYTKSLGKNTRLKLLNRRKVFEEMGVTSMTRMQSDHIGEKFDLLNSLHSKRWNQPAFEDLRLKFNLAVAELMAEKDCLNFSILKLNDEPISIQYNYVVNRHNYNIQAGFDESFHKKISLGYLHFGYEIEASFDENYLVYDFLAGAGKNTQYKERLTETYVKVTVLQVIRNPLLKLLYRAFDGFNKLKSSSTN